MNFKAFQFGINLYSYCKYIQNPELAFTESHLSRLVGLAGALNINFSPSSNNTANSIGNLASRLMLQLEAQYNKETASAFWLGFMLPSFGDSIPKSIEAELKIHWVNLGLKESALEEYITA